MGHARHVLLRNSVRGYVDHHALSKLPESPLSAQRSLGIGPSSAVRPVGWNNGAIWRCAFEAFAMPLLTGRSHRVVEQPEQRSSMNLGGPVEGPQHDQCKVLLAAICTENHTQVSGCACHGSSRLLANLVGAQPKGAWTKCKGLTKIYRSAQAVSRRKHEPVHDGSVAAFLPIAAVLLDSTQTLLKPVGPWCNMTTRLVPLNATPVVELEEGLTTTSKRRWIMLCTLSIVRRHGLQGAGIWNR